MNDAFSGKGTGFTPVVGTQYIRCHGLVIRSRSACLIRIMTGPQPCSFARARASMARATYQVFLDEDALPTYEQTITDCRRAAALEPTDELAGPFPGNYFTPISESHYTQYAGAADDLEPHRGGDQLRDVVLGFDRQKAGAG